MTHVQQLRSFDPPADYREWKVLVEDMDGGRVWVTVHAMGRHDARNLAREKARDLGYDVAACLTEEMAA